MNEPINLTREYWRGTYPGVYFLSQEHVMLATDQMVCDMVDAGCKVAEAQASWLQERAIENAQQDMKTTDLPSTRQGFNAILQAAAKYGCKLVAADGSVVTF